MTNYIIEDLRRTMVRVAANQRWYEQAWLGVPIWQLPEDMIRLQQIVHEIKPTWIIETGTKFGGSAIFFASLLELISASDGGVITIDITVLPEARRTFATHRLGHLVHACLEGDAKDKTIVDQVYALTKTKPGTILVFLDDNHNADHVYAEMELYAPLVSVDSYLVVADTVFGDLSGTPLGDPSSKYPDVAHSNPRVAVQRFLSEHNSFILDVQFANKGISNFPDGFLKHVR